MNRYLGLTFGTAGLLLGALSGALGQTATLLPNAIQYFMDNNGKPLANGKVFFYVPSTTTGKTVWTTANESVAQPQPVPLGISGRPASPIYGDGIYRQVVQDQFNNVIWDFVTASTGGGSGPSPGPTVGDGNIVGTILPWAGLAAPPNYVFAYGQPISRTTYPLFTSTVTITTNLICTSGLNVLSGIADTSQIHIGTPVEASCIPPGTTVTAVATSAVTLSANASVSTAISGTFFPFGNGDGATTLNVPDLRGRTLYGRNNMGGTASSNLTAQYFGAGSGPNAQGSPGGQQSFALATINLPPYTPAGTIANGAITISGGTNGATTTAQATATSGHSFADVGPAIVATQATSTFTGTPGGGSAVPLPLVSPGMTMNYVVKVLPDASTMVATGVASLGGMTGVLACGSGLTCGSQTVAVIPPNINHPKVAIYATDYGVVCDGSTDDSGNLQNAINAGAALGGATVILPAGTCEIAHQVYLNKFVASGQGILTVPGFALTGQGKGVTKLDTQVANNWMLAVNPDWKAAYQAAYLRTAGTSGSLASNTYYVRITMNDGLGNEITTANPQTVVVSGPSGSISIPLGVLNTGYSYNIYCDTVATPAHYCSLSGMDASAVAGNQTVTVTALGTAHVVPTALQAIWQQASISNLSITNNFATADSSGILYFKVGYSDITDVTLTQLSTNGLDIPNYTGDSDGSFVVTVDRSKFDIINGWCINAAGNALEFSNFTVQNSVFNACGALPTNFGSTHSLVMTGITNANPGVVTTASGHGLLPHDQVWISGVTGMTLAAGFYQACGTVSGSTFSLCTTAGANVNTTALGSYTASSGSEYLTFRPPTYNIVTGTISGSGAIAYDGLISNWLNLGFTQNNNTNFYFSEAGSSDNATFTGIDLENTYGAGAYLATLDGGAWNQGEILCSLTNNIGFTTVGIQLGTGFGVGGVKNFVMGNTGSLKVRSTCTPSIMFAQYPNTLVGATYQDSVRIGSKTDWQQYDASNQTRYSGFIFDPIPGQVKFSISGANTAQLIPLGYGGTLPLHLALLGEWIAYHVATAGITGSVTGGLSANTQYNCFAKNTASSANPIAIGFACNAHTTALNEGYSVDSTDATWTFIGTAVTDGSGNFQTSGTQTSWYPPDVLGSIPAGTWVPTDQSGATLTFTNGGSNFAKTNKTCTGNFHITYPSTANGSSAAVSLPCTLVNNGSQAIGSCTTSASGANGFLSLSAAANTAAAGFAQITGLTAPTNANLSTAVVECFFTFITP